ncbi:MAG: hypothetical protein ACREA0_23100, partial [bacterium]
SGEELQDGRLTYRSHHEWEVVVGDHDPASTALSAKVDLGLERTAWQVGTKGRVAITADADWFYLEVGLEAIEGGDQVFERTWKDRIERIHA